MNLVMEKTLEQYEKLFSMEEQKREDEFRYTMMKPFEKMWSAIQVPLRAKEPNGYDVIMAVKMLGYLDVCDTEAGQKTLQILKESYAAETAESALRQCIHFAEREQLRVDADEIKFGLYIADPNRLQLQKGLLRVWRNTGLYSYMDESGQL
ncbi:hypothetical protein [Bacillus sp. SPARC3]|uniref:hypothetical protein n=1 Tax=Bacillus sp. SPARC3 TaxID=2841275 RepID=UPI0037BE866E